VRQYKAFVEFVEAHQVKFEYIGYTWSGIHPYQVAVRILSINAPERGPD
jgi:hypothetical protein